jgi:hypothetical protein
MFTTCGSECDTPVKKSRSWSFSVRADRAFTILVAVNREHSSLSHGADSRDRTAKVRVPAIVAFSVLIRTLLERRREPKKFSQSVRHWILRQNFGR